MRRFCMSSFTKVVSLYRNACTLCVVSALLSFVSMGIADAQTVIKERIELQPHIPGRVLGDNPTEEVYVAEDSDMYAGTIELAHKYTPLVPGRLSITKRGEIFDYNAADYLRFFYNGHSEEDTCRTGRAILYTEYHARYDLWDNRPLRFFLPDVHVGDTLHFVYHGSTDILPGPGSVTIPGNVTMCIRDPGCYGYFEGELQELEVCALTFGSFNADFAGFNVLTERDTISHGEATAVRAIAVSSDGGEVQIDSTTMIRYTEIPDT